MWGLRSTKLLPIIFVCACMATADDQSELALSDNALSTAVLINHVDDDDCPMGLISGLPLDDEFGPGTQAITRCLQKKPIKVVYQLNQSCTTSDCAKAYGLGNIKNALDDYEITHGLSSSQIDLNIIMYSKAYRLVLDNDATEVFTESNPFQAQVEALLTRGAKIYFCQNTARNKGIVTANLIPGIRYVTAGVTAIADFQLLGFAVVMP
ncbi:MAG: DsrE family protein [Gammaproteobacteria bacterium]|nr:DsrE family protein [Gammaproteobacteria bacterium]